MCPDCWKKPFLIPFGVALGHCQSVVLRTIVMTDRCAWKKRFWDLVDRQMGSALPPMGDSQSTLRCSAFIKIHWTLSLTLLNLEPFKSKGPQNPFPHQFFLLYRTHFGKSSTRVHLPGRESRTDLQAHPFNTSRKIINWQGRDLPQGTGHRTASTLGESRRTGRGRGLSKLCGCLGKKGQWGWTGQW